MNTPEFLLLGGKPCSGKTTLGKALVDSCLTNSISHFSIGNRLRAIEQGEIDSDYNYEVKEAIANLKRSVILPYNLVNNVFREYAQSINTDLIVIDNYPAYPETLNLFKDTVRHIGAKVIAFCLIDVDDSVALQRAPIRGARYIGIKEDISFMYKKLIDYHQNVEPTLNQMSREYRFLPLDGTKPVINNVLSIKKFLNTV